MNLRILLLFGLVILVVLAVAAWLYWPSFAGTRGTQSVETLTDHAYFQPQPDAWQQFLDGVVDPMGNIRYQVAAGPLKDHLADYLDQVARATPAAFAHDRERLALYINAYNAMVISGILRYWPISSVDDAGPFHHFFRERVYVIAHTRVSLHGFETNLIRKYDPRMHFALNCASASCPPLNSNAYRAETLEAQLDAATGDFINNPRFNRYDAKTNTWYLSKIFQWYASDFGGETGIRELLARYAEPESRREQVSSAPKMVYLDYDWRLNSSTQ